MLLPFPKKNLDAPATKLRNGWWLRQKKVVAEIENTNETVHKFLEAICDYGGEGYVV